MRFPVIIWSAFVALCWAPLVAAQTSPLFSSDEPIRAVLSAPITQAYLQKKQDVRLYMDGTFSFRDSAQTTRRLPVKIRTRGNFRRRNCEHPPLRLNFQKKGNDGTLLEKQDKLKLVGPCDGSSSHQDYVGLEYLAYQIWQIVSPYHFKTRLVELSYVDTDKKQEPRTSLTFLIEDLNDVAKRADRQQWPEPSVKRRQLSNEHSALVEMFELFIGNTDYSILVGAKGEQCCHNARLLVEKDQSAEMIPVPYDFDSSGFVDAPYATPSDKYPILEVRKRYFTGLCKEQAHFDMAIATFTQHKDDITRLLKDSPVISDVARGKALRYTNQFFDLVANPKRAKRKIFSRCRGDMING